MKSGQFESVPQSRMVYEPVQFFPESRLGLESQRSREMMDSRPILQCQQIPSLKSLFPPTYQSLRHQIKPLFLPAVVSSKRTAIARCLCPSMGLVSIIICRRPNIVVNGLEPPEVGSTGGRTNSCAELQSAIVAWKGEGFNTSVVIPSDSE